MSDREVLVNVKETEGVSTNIAVTPDEVRIHIAKKDATEADEIVEEILDLVEYIPNTIIRTLRGGFRNEDGLMRLTSNGGSYGYHFHEGELVAIKYKGDYVYGTGWSAEDD